MMTREEALQVLEAIISAPTGDERHQPWAWRQYDALAIAPADILGAKYSLHCVTVLFHEGALFVATSGKDRPNRGDVEWACQKIQENEELLSKSWSAQEQGRFHDFLERLEKERDRNKGRTSPSAYRNALHQYAQREKVKLAQPKFLEGIRGIAMIASKGRMHAELSLLQTVHDLMPSLNKPEDREGLYFGNNKLNCAKCEWYFGHYAGWEGAKFLPLSRGSHALATAQWQEPDLPKLNEWLSPGLSSVRAYSNAETMKTLYQDLLDEASDSAPETEDTESQEEKKDGKGLAEMNT